MSIIPPAHQSPQDPNAPIPVAEPGFEVHVHEYWAKNRGMILMVLTGVVVAIIGWQGWQHFAAVREQNVRDEYAKIGDQTAKLPAFVEAHSGHSLAGVARLRLADEKYTAGDYKSAGSLYVKAAEGLQNDILLGRAKLGAAVSQLKAGDQTAGEAALKALSADTAVNAGARAEAAYHLATIALDAGKTDEAKKFADEVSKIEATGPWAQRAAMLLASLPFSAAPSAAPAADSGVMFKPAGN